MKSEILKKVEYNILGGDNMYNVRSKSTLDEIFFGRTNSFVEYVYAPTFREALALRVVKDSIAYRLEISRLPEYNKVLREYQNLYSSPRTEDSSMTFTEKMLSSYKSQQDSIKYVRELYKSYRPTPASFEISEKFALKLHDKIADRRSQVYQVAEKDKTMTDCVWNCL